MPANTFKYREEEDKEITLFVSYATIMEPPGWDLGMLYPNPPLVYTLWREYHISMYTLLKTKLLRCGTAAINQINHLPPKPCISNNTNKIE